MCRWPTAQAFSSRDESLTHTPSPLAPAEAAHTAVESDESFYCTCMLNRSTGIATHAAGAAETKGGLRNTIYLCIYLSIYVSRGEGRDRCESIRSFPGWLLYRRATHFHLVGG